MPSFSKRSQARLDSCDPRLVELFNAVIKHFDCTVLCGHRGPEEQGKAFTEGRSKARWGQSRHNSKPSMAADVVPYPIDWGNRERFFEFAGFVQGVAASMDIKTRWGGHFEGFFDRPHFEIVDGNQP